MKLGATIRYYRKQKNPSLNQMEFWKLVGITQSYASLIENDLKTPSPALIMDICRVLEVPYPVLLWKSIDEYDIPEGKRDYYKWMEPMINKMLDELFE